MYLGRLVEVAATDRLFARPLHPYTRLLLETIPRLDAAEGDGSEREKLPGEVPNPIEPPPGCAFHPRCPFADERCRRECPELIETAGTLVACHAVAEGRLPEMPRPA
jgi:peptide/nickel transport system ATP-binding protein